MRLTGVVAQQYQLSSSLYVPVDSYALTQTMPPTGDGTAATLWLSQIVHTGSALAGGATDAATAPPITFTPIQLQNRVDTFSDGLPAFYKYRLQTITTETGSQINVTYDLVDPCTAPVKLTASSNTASCYPVSWTPEGYTAPITDWFNKFVVSKVMQTDPTGGASAQTTVYKYLGGAAWRYDENELVKAKYRTYGQFRGYREVVTYLGDGVNDRQAKTSTVYHRGMSKNNNSIAVNLTDSLGGVHEDVDQLAGMAMEKTEYLGDTVDNSMITSYWVSADAASRSRTGLTPLTSNWVAPVETFTRQAVGAGWRYTQSDTAYVSSPSDALFGLPTTTYTHTSPVDKAYDTCETTKYAATGTLVGLAAEVEKVSVACDGFTAGAKPSAPGSVNTLTAPASVSRPAQVISATRTFYDDQKWDTTFPQTTAPTKGDVTMIREAFDHTGGATSGRPRNGPHSTRPGGRLRRTTATATSPRPPTPLTASAWSLPRTSSTTEPERKVDTGTATRQHAHRHRRQRRGHHAEVRRDGPAHRGLAREPRDHFAGEQTVRVRRDEHRRHGYHHESAQRFWRLPDLDTDLRRTITHAADARDDTAGRPHGFRHVLRQPRLGDVHVHAMVGLEKPRQTPHWSPQPTCTHKCPRRPRPRTTASATRSSCRTFVTASRSRRRSRSRRGTAPGRSLRTAER